MVSNSPASRRVPAGSLYCLPAQCTPASAIAWKRFPTAGSESAANVIVNEALSYRQDCRSSFKYDLQCEVSPGEEKNPQHATKLLRSATLKA